MGRQHIFATRVSCSKPALNHIKESYLMCHLGLGLWLCELQVVHIPVLCRMLHAGTAFFSPACQHALEDMAGRDIKNICLSMHYCRPALTASWQTWTAPGHSRSAGVQTKVWAQLLTLLCTCVVSYGALSTCKRNQPVLECRLVSCLGYQKEQKGNRMA